MPSKPNHTLIKESMLAKFQFINKPSLTVTDLISSAKAVGTIQNKLYMFSMVMYFVQKCIIYMLFL